MAKRKNYRMLAIAGIAVLSMIMAIMLRPNRTPPPPVQQAPIAKAPAAPPPPDPTQVEDILVSVTDLNIGQRVTRQSLTWKPWPKIHLPADAIKRKDFPDAAEQMINTVARQQINRGNPFREKYIVRANDNSGVMAAMLPPGWRAVALRTDASGATNAGNFILPGDRIDIMVTPRNSQDGNSTTQTLFRNVKVMAVNNQVAVQPNQNSIPASTVTLMLNQVDSIKLTDIQRTHNISLTLRPIADHELDPPPTETKSAEGSKNTWQVEIHRYGISPGAR